MLTAGILLCLIVHGRDPTLPIQKKQGVSKELSCEELCVCVCVCVCVCARAHLHVPMRVSSQHDLLVFVQVYVCMQIHACALPFHFGSLESVKALWSNTIEKEDPKKCSRVSPNANPNPNPEENSWTSFGTSLFSTVLGQPWLLPSCLQVLRILNQVRPRQPLIKRKPIERGMRCPVSIQRAHEDPLW